MLVRVLIRWILISVCLYVSFMTVPVVAQETEAPPTPPADAAVTPSPTATPIIRPTSRQTLSVGDATVELYFDSVKQGGFGVLHVSGEGVTAATASWLGDLIPLFPARDDGLFGFLTANIEQTSKEYDLEVFVESGASRASVMTKVRVELGGFVRSTFIVPSDRVYLIDPEIERAEFARLSAVFAKPDQARAWDDSGFAAPIFGELTSPFGELRLLNDTVETRHTGWDMRATTGVPIAASAAGRVAFAGIMDIRGNYVIVDHGFGVFSGYAHMSQIHVTRGQQVTAGQVLGLTGNTGRSSGPHLHWELNINGDWVDASDFSRAWIP
ncbi:MAG: M23 family metallopeptidase [Anaerolineae bacterium]|nr:M23 family metallopeptidase [Anaerolineae bacterium]